MIDIIDSFKHVSDMGNVVPQLVHGVQSIGQLASSFVSNFGQANVLSPPDISPLPRTTNADSAFIQRALSVVFVVIGAISVLMIVIGGIKFAGSQGDAQGVAKARNTIIYAIVGLIVSILATVIVDVVIGRVAG